MTNQQRIKLVEDLIKLKKFQSAEEEYHNVWYPDDDDFRPSPHYKIDISCWRDDAEAYVYIDADDESVDYGAVIGIQLSHDIESMLDIYCAETVTEFVDRKLEFIRLYR